MRTSTAGTIRAGGTRCYGILGGAEGISKAIDSGFELIIAGGERKAKVAFASATKGDTRNKGDMSLLKRPVSEGDRIEPASTNVGEGVKRTFDRSAVDTFDAVQPR